MAHAVFLCRSAIAASFERGQRTFVCEAELNEAAVRNGLKRLQGKPPYGRRFCRGRGGVLQQAFLVGVTV